MVESDFDVKVLSARAAIEASLALAFEPDQRDPLEVVREAAERVYGHECKTSYDPDNPAVINICVMPKLEQVYFTVTVK